MRSAALIIAGLDAALGIFIVCDLLFFSASDQATRGFDFASVWIVGILLAFTAFPALLLAGSSAARGIGTCGGVPCELRCGVASCCDSVLVRSGLVQSPIVQVHPVAVLPPSTLRAVEVRRLTAGGKWISTTQRRRCGYDRD